MTSVEFINAEAGTQEMLMDPYAFYDASENHKYHWRAADWLRRTREHDSLSHSARD